MRGLWILPSRRRIQKLTGFFKAAMDNGISSSGVALVEKNELMELMPEYEGIPKPENWGVLPTMADGFGDKNREIWPAIKDLDWVGLACDDLRPQTQGWDTKLLERVNGKNIVTCDDGVQGNARMSGITIFSGPLLRAIGYLYAQGFWHTYMDNVWEDIGRATDCWTYVGEVLVTHDHPFTNQKLDPLKTDDTTTKSYGQQKRDAEAYERWKKFEMAGVLERVRAL